MFRDDSICFRGYKTAAFPPLKISNSTHTPKSIAISYELPATIMTQTITLYSHASGPNPWKVAIILEELGLPYKTEMLEFENMKKAPYEAKNPNGR